MGVIGYQADDGWAERLRNARRERFSTTWQAAKALGALDPHLPGIRQLHRYWSQRWEPGKIRPSHNYRDLIEKLLDAPGLFSGEQPPPAPVQPDTGEAGASGMVAQAGLSNWAMRPHSLVSGEADSRTELEREVRMATDEAADHVAASDTGVGERTVDQIREDVRRLARGYNLRSLPDVFRDARQIRGHAARLTTRTQRPSQLADLHALAGQACGVLANAAFDMGYWDAAARFADSALTYGELSGHGSLRAWALGMQGFVAHWQGRPIDALTKLDEALTTAPVGTARVRLHSIAARTYGQLGNADGVAHAVRAAEEARVVDSHDDLHDGVGGELGYEPARDHVSAATGYVRLGDGAAAEQHAQRALDLYESAPVGERAYYAEYGARVDLAAARVLRGDLSGARHALVPVFALAPGQRVAGVLGRLDQVRRLLDTGVLRDSRDARQLTTDITDVTTATPSQPLPADDA